MNSYISFFLGISLLLSEISDMQTCKNFATQIYLYMRDFDIKNDIAGDFSTEMYGFCETYAQILWDLDYTNAWGNSLYLHEDIQNVSRELSYILQKFLQKTLCKDDIDKYNERENQFLKKYNVWYMKQIFS